jgi:hypothetical protein
VEKIPPIYIHHHMQVLCWDKYVDINRLWVWQFKWEEMGKASLCDTAGSGRPVTATDDSHKKLVKKMIWENHQIKQKDITLKLGISKEGVGHVINLLGFRKVHARWVHENWLMRWKLQEILGHFEGEGEVISVVGSDRWWNLGQSLWSWKQKTVYGILPQRITSAKEIQNWSLWWKCQVDCILEQWRWCAY